MTGQADLFAGASYERTATFSGPGIRLTLTRRWARGPVACVIGHNPSDADADKDDPTSRWWNRWFAANGYAGYTAVNLYPFCSPDPAACRALVERAAAGEEPWRTALAETNPAIIAETIASSNAAFVCWGGIARDQDHIAALLSDVERRAGRPLDLQCWGLTKDGAPTHPMARGRNRIDPNAAPIPFNIAKDTDHAEQHL